MKDGNTYYQTKDFYIAACILAGGVQLIKLSPINHKSFDFVFDIPLSEAEDIVQQHWQRKLTLPSRNLVDALHELKTRIYTERNEI